MAIILTIGKYTITGFGPLSLAYTPLFRHQENRRLCHPNLLIVILNHNE